METSPLIFRENEWTGFYMITASIIKELKQNDLDTNFHNSLDFPYFHSNDYLRVCIRG